MPWPLHSLSRVVSCFSPDTRAVELRECIAPDPGSLGDELLGWWIVPLGLLIGAGLFLLTTRFGLWGLRRLRGMSPVRLR